MFIQVSSQNGFSIHVQEAKRLTRPLWAYEYVGEYWLRRELFGHTQSFLQELTWNKDLIFTAEMLRKMAHFHHLHYEIEALVIKQLAGYTGEQIACAYRRMEDDFVRDYYAKQGYQ